jgi:hypothetical protein
MRLQRRRRSPGARSSGARERGRRQALPFAIARCSAHASPRADAAAASAHRGEHGGQHVQHFSAVRRGAGRQNAPATGDARAAPRAGRHRGLAAPRLLRRLLLGRHHGAAAGEARPARRERLTRGVRRTRSGPNPKRAGATLRRGRRALTPPSAPGAARREAARASGEPRGEPVWRSLGAVMTSLCRSPGIEALLKSRRASLLLRCRSARGADVLCARAL